MVKRVHELREFGTFTEELYDMKRWLLDNNCPILAMESTGVYCGQFSMLLRTLCKCYL